MLGIFNLNPRNLLPPLPPKAVGLLVACLLFPLAVTTGGAQQTTGTPGSPSATSEEHQIIQHALARAHD